MVLKSILSEGYGLMPNKVLFDPDIPSTAKLLYVLISSLCAEKGYCYANNAYLGGKLGISTVSISQHIKALNKYLIITNPKNEKRQMCLKENLILPLRKLNTSHKENFKHNITSEYYKLNTVKELKRNTEQQLNKPDNRAKPSPAKEALRKKWSRSHALSA